MFYGLSSCYRNDADWRGAALSSTALEQAGEHIRAHTKDFLKIAVWHHGLTSERGSPDHLTLKEVGLLAAMDLRLGLHGHTHMTKCVT